jgi:hypothetical protein
MLALRRNRGFGMVEFLAVTVAVALFVSLAIVCYARHEAAGASEVTPASPQRASASGTVSFQTYSAPLRPDTRVCL